MRLQIFALIQLFFCGFWKSISHLYSRLSHRHFDFFLYRIFSTNSTLQSQTNRNTDKNPKRISLLVPMFICVVGLVLTSCQKKELPPDEEAITQLPEDTRSLFVEKGDTGAQIAILYCNGRPDTTLDTSYFDDLGLSNFHEVYVHQANTYNDELIIGLNA